MNELLAQAARKNIPILHDDINFIRKMTPKIPYNLRKEVYRRYLDIWVREQRVCSDRIKAHNAGRFAANQFLLAYDYVERL